MDFINDFIHESYLQAIGWTLIHSIWQVVLVSLLLWAGLRSIPHKASNIRYWAGLGAMLMIAVASGITFSMVLETPSPTGATASISMSIADTKNLQVATPRYEITAHTSPTDSSVLDQTWLPGLEHYLPALVNLWLLGALFYIFKLSGGLLDLRSLNKKHRQSVPDPLIKKVNGMIAAMGFYRGVKVLKSELIHVPVTYGFLKPVILIPAGLLFCTPPRQLEAIIAHELAHIKRYDYLVNILQRTMEVFFFFHPCFWWINEMIDTDREHACDDLVLSLGYSPGELARGLAEVAEQAQTATPEMALAATGNQHSFLNRIKRILGKEQNKEKISPLITLTMLISLMVSASLVMGAIPAKENIFSDNYLLTKIEHKSTYKKVSLPCQVIEPCNEAENTPEIVKNTTKTYAYHYAYGTDTTPAPKAKAHKNTPAPVDDPMPVLELSPMPDMDFEVPPVPAVPPFEGMNFVPPMPAFQLDITEEAMELANLSIKLSQLDGEDSEEAQQKRKVLQAQLEEVQDKMEAKTEIYEEKMKEWEAQHESKMEEWEAKMEAWSKEMEAKQSEWETAYEPKMEEYEQKIEAWEKASEPKIKEFEAKMEAWQERQLERQEKLKQQQQE
ncbi:M48 family metalloprotease [Echinicola soli]|uniref:M48 family metalloprotease n=1 Tax=Echinicola soli TaxID=2591634 RepID=A0A514CHG3_9BACT|nr:M56 family metallopeptidase [Echinicola soli]QDH79263.1 M48 family metalloprotease [Echinicola soli]